VEGSGLGEVFGASRIIWWVKPHSFVVPGHDLDQRAVHDPGELQVDDRGAWVTNHVGRDQRVVRDAEDALVALGRCLLPECVVDLLGGGRLAGVEDDVGDRPSGTGARRATPSNLQVSSGRARVVDCAAPVEAETRLAAAARPRRKLLLGLSTSCWVAV